jgi:hypothetical protein
MKFSLFFILILASSCNSRSDRKPPASSKDTVVVSNSSAVFFNPDEDQWKKIKRNTDSMKFDSYKHDCYYQQRNARNVLKENYSWVEVVELSGARYIMFKSGTRPDTCIDLNGLPDICGIYLFENLKAPLLVEMTNFDRFASEYFTPPSKAH